MVKPLPSSNLILVSSMSRFGLSPRLCAATLFLAIGLRAQDKPDTTPKPEGMMNASMSNRAQDIIKRFDKNGDGKIDEDERADAQDIMMKERLDKQPIRFVSTGDAAMLRTQLLVRFDRNRDGQLNDEERAEAQKIAEDRATDPAIVALRAEFLKRFDLNSDGKVDGNETVAVREFFADRAGQPALGSFGTELRQDLVKRYDRNSDGKIDEAEMTGAAEGLRLGLAVAAMRGDRFDLNFDGKLSDEEWTAARQQLQRWLNGEMVFPGPVTNPTPADEQRRLNAVAAEVERRRLLREGAAGLTGSIPPPPIQSGPGSAVSPKTEAEKARLEAMAAEVARRRAEREGAAK